MKRRPFRFPLSVERLEDRDAPVGHGDALLAGFNQPFAALPESAPPAFFVAGR